VTTIEGKATLDKERAKGALAPTPSKGGTRGGGGGSTGRWGQGSKESNNEGVKATEGSSRARTERIERHPGPHGVIPT
jgi:hypothetical protein